MNIDIKKIKNISIKVYDACFQKIKKIPWIIGNHAFLMILIFVVLDILFIEFLFYQYLLLPEIRKPPIGTPLVEFREDIYQTVLQKSGERQKKSEQIGQESYTDPFHNSF